jgi:hypothetical protein
MHPEDVRQLLHHGAARPSRGPDIGGIVREGRRLKRRRLMAATVAVVLVVVASSTNLGLVGDSAPHGSRPATSSTRSEGWTELPTPPEVRGGIALLWAGSELLAWGGCEPPARHECVPSSEGSTFDTASGTWEPIDDSPRAGAYADAVWTGEEAIFFHAEDDRWVGQAYDAATGRWRALPRAPIRARSGAAALWTDSEVILWGGGKPEDPTARNGAAYDPERDRWRRIAEAPLGLNSMDAVWTGSEMLVFGSLLDNRNIAATDTAVGAAYDPDGDLWRKLRPSELSPQATAAAWLGERMVAWDYEVRSQEYDPESDTWSGPARMPLEFSECYPDNEVVGGNVFAFYCGYAALYDTATSDWSEIHGGPLEAELEAASGAYKLWRFADLVPTGEVVYLLAEGITTTDSGEVCYGCPGSPTSFWAYRPPS